MDQLSLKQCIQGLRQGEFSSLELTQFYFNRIHQQSELNAFISLNEEQALLDAQKADRLLQKGEASLLTGIPLALKDLFCTLGMKTTCASKMLADFQAPYEATIVERLRSQQAIIVGKTNMDEFAMGSANENSYFGPVKNPWDTTRVPGGSSGGSAAAVAAGMVPLAIGSDTGGSVRQPAAFCGLSGLKPTYGLVSRYGMVAFASSLDQAGIFTKSAEDLALVLPVVAGFDPKDSTSVQQKLPAYELSLTSKAWRIGLPSCFLQQGLAPDILAAIQDAIKLFKDMGAEIVPLDLSLQDLWVPCYYVIACAEASSNLSRYDGVRYGHRSSRQSSLTEMITASRSEGFGSEVKRRILTGTHVLSAGYFDAYYLQAQKIRRLIQGELVRTLNSVDFMLGPTTPTTAFKLGEKKSPVENYLGDVFTVAANLAGLPALSIPAGFSEGLPIGMQLIGKPFDEALLLSAAHAFQQHSDWHLARPAITR